MRCGTVAVSADQVTLLMTAAGSPDSRSVVSFLCPSCGDPLEQPVDERTSRLLTAAGVSLGIPAELPRQRDRS